jgi:pSer/pThr/pTyr-binding forkhead associated (FHA) protein
VFAYLAAAAQDDAGYAVVTDRFLCLLGAGTSAEATRELYRALEADPVHIDDVLDALVARHGLEHFGIVEMIDAEQRTMDIAVRGAVTVNLDGSTTTRLSGPTGATWITGEARGVNALSLSLETGADGEESLPIRRGVVRAHSLAIEEGGADVVEPRIPDEATLLTVPIDLERIREASAALQLDTPPVVTPAPKGKSTPTRIDLPAPSDPHPATPASALWVRLPDGNLLDAATPIVVGRRPWSTESDTQSAVHVAVPSPLREVSATHLEVAEVDGGLTARDLGSTNGTVVLSPDRAPRLLDARRSTALVDGDVLDVGEGFRLLIVATPAR